MPAKRSNGSFLVLAAATLWGTTGTSQALAPSGATPLAIGALRLLAGGLFLIAFAALRGRLGGLRRLPIRPLLGAAVCIAAYQVLFFAGVKLSGVAVGTMVGIGSGPIWGGLIGMLFEGERPGSAWLLATLLALGGAALLALPAGGVLAVDPLGLLLAVGAGAAYAAFTLFNKRLLAGGDPEIVQAGAISLGACLLLPILAFSNLAWVATGGGALVVLHLGLVTVGMAYTLFGLGLRWVPVSSAVTLTLAEPMTASLLGVFLLGETLSLTALAGVGMIFSGLAVLASAEGKRSAGTASAG